MKATTTRLLRAALLACAALAGFGAAAQDTWPSKPIRIFVPFAPGLSPDVVSRLIADPLSRSLGQPVIIENKVGAAGIIGAEAAAKSPPDGYTLLMSVNSVMGINPAVYKKLPYDTFRDFTPVTQVALVPYVLVTAPSQPYAKLEDVLREAKAKPKSVNYASIGVATGPHVVMEMVNNMAGTQMTHVPYKGTPIPDVIGGVVPLFFDAATTAIPLVKSGKLRALGVTSKKRLAALPDTPTIGEVLPGYDGDGWQGFYLPAGTPAPIVARFNTAIVQILRMPDVQRRLGELGLQVVGSSVEEFTKVSKDEVEKWTRIARANNISAD